MEKKCQPRCQDILDWKMIVQKSALKFWHILNMEIGKTHSGWNATLSEVPDVKKSIIKARMVAGVYILQKEKLRFDKIEAAYVPFAILKMKISYIF